MGLKSTRYDEEFKQSLVALYNNGKIMSDLCKEYGVSKSALSKWIKLYSTVKMDDGDIMTAKQIKDLQKKLAQLEEENLILANCQVKCDTSCKKTSIADFQPRHFRGLELIRNRLCISSISFTRERSVFLG